MEKTKKTPVLSYLLFMLVVPFMVVATFSRYPGFEISDRVFIITPVIAIIVTALWYIYHRRTGKGAPALVRPGNRGVATLFYSFYSAIFAFLILSTLLRFDIINVSETALYLISLGIGVVTAIIYLICAPVRGK